MIVGDLQRQKNLPHPDLQSLDLSQVGLLSLLQTPPLRILLLDKLHLPATDAPEEAVSVCGCVCRRQPKLRRLETHAGI